MQPRIKKGLINFALTVTSVGAGMAAVVLGVRGKVGQKFVNGVSGAIGGWVRSIY